MSQFHQSVLLKEVIKFLDVKPGCRYIDATIGGGGHAVEILKRGGRVLGIDRDLEAIEHLKNQFKILNLKFKIGQDLIFVRDNFSHIDKVAREAGFNQVDGIIFDLGVSSYQLEKTQRGFSFVKEGPLDMRMDSEGAITAADLINTLDKRRLYEILKTYGQEKLSRPIADAIYRARQIRPIETTTELAKIVEEVYRKYFKRTIPGSQAKHGARIHPATKTFLALRIVVNSELLNLKEALPQTVDLLDRGGRLAIISFHSLEDGIVKRFFKQEEQLMVLTKKPIGPGAAEILKNPRSRSAKLRIAQKL